MHAVRPSSSIPSPALRYLTATLLLFTPPPHAGATELRQQAFGITGWRRHCRLRRRSSTTGSNGSDSTASSHHLSRAKFTTAVAATMSENDGNRGGGGGGGGGGDTSGETGLSLPVFLRRCSSSAGEQQQRGLSTAVEGAAAAAAAPGAIFHVFSGNEACDADSMCSAICMAYLRQNTAARSAPAGGEESILYVPVMPIPRADLALRREVLVLFELCGVDPCAVVFEDELDLSALQSEGRLRLTLMDHNAVSGGLSELGGAVVEIIDHHADLGVHPSVRGDSRDVAFDASDGSGKALVGSCCTMVAERMLDQAPGLLSSDLARLLLGVILVDTINLDADAKRATERDVAAAEQLSRRVAWSPSALGAAEGRSCATPDALFDTLRNAKFDPAFWGELSATDCLRYDYKSFHAAGESSGIDSGCDGGATVDPTKPPRSLKFGVSSVLCRLETLADKGGEKGSSDALRAFAVAQGVDSLSVMTSTLDQDQTMKKELLVFTHTKLRCDQMRKYFEGLDAEFLHLQATAPPTTCFGGGSGSDKAEEEGRGWFLQWELGNVRPSRKQVAPAIASFYESISNGC